MTVDPSHGMGCQNLIFLALMGGALLSGFATIKQRGRVNALVL